MKNLLLLVSLVFMLSMQMFAQTPYAYYPYYHDGTQTAFEVPTDKVDADLDATTNRASYVMLGSWFDQTNSGGVPSYIADDGFTIIKDPTEADPSFTPTLTDDRIVTETTAVTTHAKWNYTGDYFDRRGMTLFYTVHFSEATDYNLYLRQRTKYNMPYTVDIYSVDNMDVAIKTFNFNVTGMSATAEALSSDNKAQYVNVAGGDTYWLKVLEKLTITATGNYVVKIKTSKGFGWNFGGFTLFKAPIAASAEVTLMQPVAPGAAALVNTPTKLIASAAPLGTNNITKVEFFEGANLLGEGVLNGASYEFDWMPTTAGSYTISAKVTDSGANTATSATGNIEIVNSLAYVSRASWTTVIEFEDYDFGGSEYGAFVDKTSSAPGAVEGYRTDGTDIKPNGSNTGLNVQLGTGGTGWTVGYANVGDKVTYTIPDVPAGQKILVVNYASTKATELMVTLNGVDLGIMDLASTTDWNIYQDGYVGNLSLEGDADSDDDVIAFEFKSGGCNLDYFYFTVATNNNTINESSLAVYPNPSQGTFTINSGTNEVSTYRVISLNGQELKSGSFVGQTQVTLNTGRGLYLLETKTLDNTSTQKIIIK